MENNGIYYIEWIDASTRTAAWTFDDELEDYVPLILVKSVGFIIKETDEFISLAVSVAEDTFGVGLSIPVNSIKIKKRL